MDTATVVGMAVLGTLMLVVLVILLVQWRGRRDEASALLAPLQSMTQAVGDLNSEMKALAERVATFERDQHQVGQGVSALQSRLAETGEMTRGLSDTAAAIRSGLDSAAQTLSALHAHAGARQELEQRTAESIRRLEAVIAGTQTKGLAGENILDVVFAQLPPEWQVRDFQVGSKRVEFGLRLPNGLILPIDSKWPGTNLVDELLAAEDPAQQQRLRSEIEKAVMNKAKEVRKYIDPSVTVNFGIAAVPDSVFDLCPRAQVESMHFNVVLLSYSMFVPYLLLAFQTILKTCQDIDVQKLAAYIDSAQDTISALQEELEGRLSKAITMLTNSRDDMRAQISSVSAGFTAIQLSTGARTGMPELPGSAQTGSQDAE